MEKILTELFEGKNLRSNLSSLRQQIKEQEKKAEALEALVGKEELFFSFFLLLFDSQ